MSEEIIIDGVDVSGCEFFSVDAYENKHSNCSCFKDMYGWDVYCEYADCCKDCYYKQLKRLQAENEELGKIIQCKTGTIVVLKTENERLKEEVKDQEDLANECLGLGGKYLQALEEIREFINPTYFDCKNCKELKKPFTQQNCNGFKYEAILNKINEVLDERN